MIRQNDLSARHLGAADEVERRVIEVLRSGRYVGGPVVAEAEAALARRLGRAAAVGVASGTDALMLALQAVGVGPGDEVIVPAISFFASAGAVRAIGAVPVIVDVREDALMDPGAAARAVSARTRAVMPVHLFGSLAEAPSLGVPVVDDAAQAVGSHPPCAVGSLTAVSVYPTKLWGAAGDGGFVAGDDPELLARVRALGQHGAVAMHAHELVRGVVGRNSRLDALQAAVLLGHDAGFDALVARRRARVARYEAGLPRGIRPLPRTEGSVASPFVVRAADRDAALDRLAAAGVEGAVYYPRSLAAQPALAAHRRPTPVADALCAELLALPAHDAMTDDDVDAVLRALAAP